METLETYLAKVITHQIQFNQSLKPDLLYDEIVGFIGNGYGDFNIETRLKNYDKIYQSSNFKYLIDTKNKSITIINKFHN